MARKVTKKPPERIRVLCLDGGGVRGLSALLILRKLLCLVNEELLGAEHELANNPRRPQEVFDIVVGTSTGGLIALMIVKLGMDVDQCITAYEELAEEIFGKPHRRGQLTLGLRVPRFRGKLLLGVVGRLVKKYRSAGERYEMEDDSHHPDLLCSVVCREINSETNEREADPVLLCSHRCEFGRKNKDNPCRVCDAARATSAAPTYFSPMIIARRILVDGGFGGTNNPSHCAYEHYGPGGERRIFDTDHTEWVNIGTGSPGKKKDRASPPRSLLDLLPSKLLRNARQTLHDISQIVTDSDDVGKYMTSIADADRKRLEFNRFSVNIGSIDRIPLFAYEKLAEIRRLTDKYLEDKPGNEDLLRLRRVARALANDIKVKRRLSKIQTQSEFPQYLGDKSVILDQEHPQPEGTVVDCGGNNEASGPLPQSHLGIDTVFRPPGSALTGTGTNQWPQQAVPEAWPPGIEVF